MSTRHKRRTVRGDSRALREFVGLAGPGRGSLTANARLRRLLDVGTRLEMTSGDTVRLAIATLRALDGHGEFTPAVQEVLDAFDRGDLLTEVREPMNLYMDRSAVTALAVAVAETCRPQIELREPGNPVPTTPPAPGGHTGGTRRQGEPGLLGQAAHWPERTADGFPQMTLEVRVWWPGLPEWEPATLTASVTRSLAFNGENFTLAISQAGDARPARTHTVWLLKRADLDEAVPVYELRASTWEPGEDEAHRYRFLVATSSPWCEELHDYLATRWIQKNADPRGPVEFEAAVLGGSHPPVRRAVDRVHR